MVEKLDRRTKKNFKGVLKVCTQNLYFDLVLNENLLGGEILL